VLVGIACVQGECTYVKRLCVSHVAPLQAQNNGTHIDSLTDVMVDLSDVVLDIITYRVIRTFTKANNR